MSNNYQAWATMKVDTQAGTPRDLRITQLRAVSRHYQDAYLAIQRMPLETSDDGIMVRDDVLRLIQERINRCTRTIADLQSRG